MFDDADYVTAGGVRVARRCVELPFATALDGIAERLDTRRGALLSSSYEFPGRYKRWSMAFFDPPLELATRGDFFTLSALNPRGAVLLAPLAAALQTHPHVATLTVARDRITGRVRAAEPGFAESERSRQPSAFSIVRAVIALLASPEDAHLGLYGAFGYDLVYQFEPLALQKKRPDDQRDLVAFVPDSLILVDNQRQRAMQLDYDFAIGDTTTVELPRGGASFDPRGARRAPTRRSDYPPGGYAALVRQALPYFARGDLFEVVPGQSFYEPCDAPPSVLFDTLRRINPSPYGFLFNLGGEYLIGASPEMFVRVEGGRVETCPISGTIARGRDALEDAERILTLLSSRKDEAELTMCTDVDRNDKSRVCRPGSVRVIGRRQIELYSHLIHTVDHVEGELRPGADGLDAFLSHAWAVTVTGAPKRAALAFIEAVETTPRRWYGGAVGCLGFNGNINTGLTLRTIHLKDSVAEVRVGATLLADSIPEDEERETHVKAAASLKTIALAQAAGAAAPAPTAIDSAIAPAIAPADDTAGAGKRVLLVDCEDSFVHTLAGYIEATGAAVTVLRHDFAAVRLGDGWDLVVLSPGPGRPAEFGVPALVQACAARGLPVFGVCLGLQGIVEAFGGALGVLPEPRHGKPGTVTVQARDSSLFRGLPASFGVGRYHSLHALPDGLPAVLRATATAEDGVVMAVEHTSLPIAGVQFHPESIMSLAGGIGPRIIANVMATLAGPAQETGHAAPSSAAANRRAVG